MPLKWFRSHRHNSTSDMEDEATLSSTKTPTTKRTKSLTQRSRRPHSQGPGLRAMIGFGRSMQFELDMSTAIAAEEEQRRILYQTKTHRRFTVQGLSTPHKHIDADLLSPVSLTHTHSWHYGLSSNRMVHGRTPRAQPMSSLALDSHPSIIFIDCPP